MCRPRGRGGGGVCVCGGGGRASISQASVWLPFIAAAGQSPVMKSIRDSRYGAADRSYLTTRLYCIELQVPQSV